MHVCGDFGLDLGLAVSPWLTVVPFWGKVELPRSTGDSGDNLKDGCRHEPGGSKYRICKDSGPEYHLGYGFLGPETLSIGYLDCLGT